MKPSWTVNPDFFDTSVIVHRDVRRPAGDGSYEFTPAVVGRHLAQVQDPQLVPITDQQGRPGADLGRTVYFKPGVDVRPGDRLELAGNVILQVQSAATRSGLYHKCLTMEEHGT